MKILTRWLRSYLPTLPHSLSDHQLAEDLTLRGIAVEGIHPLGEGNGHLYEMDITTNRVDAMNHYGIAREAATIYNIPLAPLEASVDSMEIEESNEAKPKDERFVSAVLQALLQNGPSTSEDLYPFVELNFPALVHGKLDWKKTIRGTAGNLKKAPKKLVDSVAILTSNRHKWFLTEAGVDFANERFAIASGITPSASTVFPVRIAPEAQQLCGRFTAQVLRGVTTAPSTSRVSEYFTLLGQKQISNAVDASNFTLLGMGHPTHAFDLDRIVGSVVVRLARKGERLKLLDGTERVLEADDLVIADEEKPLSLAGVMGGWDSMITPETRNILVESAWFDQATIRRSARRHGLHTDASHRFERGADFNAAPVANHLVSQLILASGGHVEGGLIDLVTPEVAARTASRAPIVLSVAQVNRHLGATSLRDATAADTGAEADIGRPLVERYLSALGCTLKANGEETASDTSFEVTLPSWRLDLEREIDLIEEIARVYGYNAFADTLPPPGIVIEQPTAAAETAVRSRLLALGYSEAISSTFASPEDARRFSPDLVAAAEAGGEGTIALENPLSEEASLLRPTLVPGMVTMLAHNLNRDVRTVRLFERGAVFSGTTSAVTEREALTLGLTGAVAATSLYSAADAPFFELKGVVQALLSLFDGATVSFTADVADSKSCLEPGRRASALLGGRPVATLGELSRAETARRKLRQPLYLAEIDLERLYAIPLKRTTARELSRYQAVERDFSFTFPEAMSWRTVKDAIGSLGIGELRLVTPTEIFRDPRGLSVPAGHYALLLRCIFQSAERTLREDELTAWWSAIIDTLTTLGGTIRA